MLYLLRRYQKSILAVVTVVIIASFCFFGTYGTLSQSAPVENKVIGTAVTGKPIYERELMALRSLLAHSIWDKDPKGGWPNLFNPGVIEKELLATGLGAMLVRPYFADFKEELDGCMRKVRAHRPYKHPHSQEISWEGLVRLLSPQLVEHASLLRARGDQATMQTWVLMSQLYIEQLSLPPEHMLRQFLEMQAQKMQLPADESLAYADLSVLGIKTLDEWFGSSFVPLAAAFIYNVGELAEERGYQISNSEVRSVLLQNIVEGYGQVARGEKPSEEEIQKYYVAQMRALGLDEQILLNAWKKVLLFQQLMEEASSSVYVDRLTEEQVTAFASEKKQEKLYQLPKHLQFSDFLSACKFQLYLDKVTQEGSLLSSVLSPQEIERVAPELVQQHVELQYKRLSSEERQAQISLKEMMKWQVQASHFEELQQQFPFLRNAQSEEERIYALNALSAKQRLELDRYTKEQMMTHDQEAIASLLALQPEKKLKGVLRASSPLFQQIAVEDKDALLLLLQQASLAGEDKKNRASQMLQCYTQDQKNFYAISVVQRDQQKQVMSFSQALSSGVLDRLLDKALEKGYPEVRKKNAAPYQLTKGGWKPLVEVKQEVAKALFQQVDLKPVIEKTKQRMETSHASRLPLIEQERIPSFLEDLYLEKQNETSATDSTLATSIQEGHRLLAQEAKRDLMTSLMQKISKEHLYAR